MHHTDGQLAGVDVPLDDAGIWAERGHLPVPTVPKWTVPRVPTVIHWPLYRDSGQIPSSNGYNESNGSKEKGWTERGHLDEGSAGILDCHNILLPILEYICDNLKTKSKN